MKNDEIAPRIRRVVAQWLDMPKSAISDELRWMDRVAPDDREYVLQEIRDLFVRIPRGFSFGSGDGPFDYASAEDVERIATAGGLIRQIEKHVAKGSS